MGFFRIYLALCVIVVHASSKVLPWKMIGGVDALRILFIISGFYMSMIISKYNSKAHFYISRALRIFPTYYIILILVVLFSIAVGQTTGDWLALNAYVNYSRDSTGLAGVVYTAITNLTVLFQGSVLFLQHDAGTNFSFTPAFLQSASPLYKFELIPPAWTVSLEILFYALLPFLARLKSRWLFLIAGVSLALRLYAYTQLGVGHDPFTDPFTYRFFPFEILFFVAGILSHRMYAAWLIKLPLPKVQSALGYLVFVAGMLLACFVAVYLNFFLRKYLGNFTSSVASALVWVFGAPLFFHATAQVRIDRFIGDLCYMVYLIHWVVVEYLKLIYGMQPWTAIATTVISLGVAIVLQIWVVGPIDRKREPLAKRLSARWAVENKLSNPHIDGGLKVD